jgi:hypothetical protein
VAALPARPRQLDFFKSGWMTGVKRKLCAGGCWCGWRDSNSHGFPRRPLKTVCLPVPPHPQNKNSTGDTTLERTGGFEPPRLSAPPPQDGVSASSTTSAQPGLRLEAAFYYSKAVRTRMPACWHPVSGDRHWNVVHYSSAGKSARGTHGAQLVL